MRQKTYLQTVATIFMVIAIVHAFRLLNGWHIQISNTVIPLWVSWVGMVAGATLAYYGFKFADKNKS